MGVTVAVIAVGVAIAVVVIAIGAEVYIIDDVGEIGQLTGIGEFLDLREELTHHTACADEVESDIGVLGDDIGIGEDTLGGCIDKNRIVLGSEFIDELTEAGSREQRDGVRHRGTGIEDMGDAGVLRGGLGDGVNHLGRIFDMIEQEVREALTTLTAEVTGEGSFTEVGIDDKDAAIGLGVGEGEVSGDEGFTLIGHGRGTEDDVSLLFCTGEEVFHIIAQDMQAFCHGRVGIFNKNVVGFFLLTGEGWELCDNRLAGIGGEIVF